MGENLTLICFDPSSLQIASIEAPSLAAWRFERHVGSRHVPQIATVDHAEMRGLVTDRTSLRRGACLSLQAGIIDQERPVGIILADTGLA